MSKQSLPTPAEFYRGILAGINKGQHVSVGYVVGHEPQQTLIQSDKAKNHLAFKDGRIILKYNGSEHLVIQAFLYKTATFAEAQECFRFQRKILEREWAKPEVREQYA